MPWTNVFNLPAPIVDLVKGDFYAKKVDAELAAYIKKQGIAGVTWYHFSVTELIKPPRVRALYARYASQLVRDVSSNVFSLLGTLFHGAFRDSAVAGELASGSGYVAEQRLFTHLGFGGKVVIISGEPDLVSPDGVIDDYKVTSVYAWEKGAKLEWEYQMNLYAWLRARNGKQTKGLRVVYIIRDWLMRQVVQEGYPQAPAQTEEVPLWGKELQDEYVRQRLTLHMDAMLQGDEDLPECTEHEMWARPESWAVIREGGERAAKLFKGEDFPEDTDPEVVRQAANADAELRNEKLKKGQKPYTVEHRPGERVRCQSYCDVRGHCNQWKEFAGATFGKAEVKKP